MPPMEFHNDSTSYCNATRSGGVESIPMVSSLQATDAYIRPVEFESGNSAILVDFYAEDGHATGSYRGPIETCIRFPDVEAAEAFARALFHKCEDVRSRGGYKLPDGRESVGEFIIDTPSAFHADNIMCRNVNGQEIPLQEMIDSMADGLNVLRNAMLPLIRLFGGTTDVIVITENEPEDTPDDGS